MTESFFVSVVSALRERDSEEFTRLIAMSDVGSLERVNDVPYANWFTGVGATLLQMTSFLRPAFTAALLERGVKVDLHSACALGDVVTMNRILSTDASAIERQVDTYYPIQFAFRHPEALRTLLQLGDDPNRPIRKVAWFEWEDTACERGMSEWRLLHMLALGRGGEPHIESAEILVAFGADPRLVALPLGELPLHVAATYNRTHLISWFVEKGVEVDVPTADTANWSSVDDLFDTQPFAPFHTHRKTSLMLALGEGQTDAVDLLLDLGADVNAIDSGGFRALHYAASPFWKENPALVRRLIERGARLDVAAAGGIRPLDLAARKGYQNTVQLLSRNSC